MWDSSDAHWDSHQCAVMSRMLYPAEELRPQPCEVANKPTQISRNTEKLQATCCSTNIQQVPQELTFDPWQQGQPGSLTRMTFRST